MCNKYNKVTKQEQLELKIHAVKLIKESSSVCDELEGIVIFPYMGIRKQIWGVKVKWERKQDMVLFGWCCIIKEQISSYKIYNY